MVTVEPVTVKVLLALGAAAAAFNKNVPLTLTLTGDTAVPSTVKSTDDVSVP